MALRPDPLPDRLTEIDELTRPRHSYLNESDDCYYLGEYRVHSRYDASAINQLISNIKISVHEPNQYRRRYKQRDIQRAGVALLQIFRQYNNVADVTIVPVPPSKMRGDPGFDGRMIQIARFVAAASAAEMQELVLQTANYEPSHTVGGGARMTPEELCAIYTIPQNAPEPRQVVLVFDDVVTRGAHFKAMQRTILDRFPEKRVAGLFLARATDPLPIDDFDAL
jgi:predicted amidophosphoribosyltransferase